MRRLLPIDTPVMAAAYAQGGLWVDPFLLEHNATKLQLNTAIQRLHELGYLGPRQRAIVRTMVWYPLTPVKPL